MDLLTREARGNNPESASYGLFIYSIGVGGVVGVGSGSFLLMWGILEGLKRDAGTYYE
jgi:hypothetical protein